MCGHNCVQTSQSQHFLYSALPDDQLRSVTNFRVNKSDSFLSLASDKSAVSVSHCGSGAICEHRYMSGHMNSSRGTVEESVTNTPRNTKTFAVRETLISAVEIFLLPAIPFISVDVKQEIQARQSEMCELMAAGKSDEAFNFYTDDCKVMPPGQEIIIGKEGIEISHLLNINVLHLYNRTVLTTLLRSG